MVIYRPSRVYVDTVFSQKESALYNPEIHSSQTSLNFVRNFINNSVTDHFVVSPRCGPQKREEVEEEKQQPRNKRKEKKAEREEEEEKTARERDIPGTMRRCNMADIRSALYAAEPLALTVSPHACEFS